MGARGYGWPAQRLLRELGAFLGLETRQATYEYLDRLDALIAAHTADQDRQAYVAAVYVAERRAAGAADRDPGVVAGPQATAALEEQDDLYRRNRGRRPRYGGADVDERRERRRDQRALVSRERWIYTHRARLDAVIGELVGQAARVGIEAVEQDTDELGVEDYLVSLDQHRGSGCYSHVTFALLGLALGELRVHRATTGLGRNHGIHQADAAADRLRARYSALAPAQSTL